MSREEHTPGPWHLVNGDVIATDQLNVVGHVSWSNRQANAALIAAAPDLLTALEAEMRPDGHALGCGVNRYPGQTACDKHCARARAAIAKATGSTGEGDPGS